MTCRRCQGLMVEIPPLLWSSADFEPVRPEEREMAAWQCLNCGDEVRRSSSPIGQRLPFPKE